MLGTVSDSSETRILLILHGLIKYFYLVPQLLMYTTKSFW
jgi:hypothetical protein